MLEYLKRRVGESRAYELMKWVLTAISGVVTTAFIFLLGPVSS